MKINLGSGDKMIPGWINIDEKPQNYPGFIQHDLRYGLPEQLKDVTIVSSSHFLEHLIHRDTVRILQQCREVMVTGGIMRACLPDFRKLVTKYLEADWEFFGHCLSVAPNHQLLEIVNYSLYQRDDGINADHKTMFDPEYAIFTLQYAGFRDCRQVEPDPEIDLIERIPYSFYVQGTK